MTSNFIPHVGFSSNLDIYSFTILEDLFRNKRARMSPYIYLTIDE